MTVFDIIHCSLNLINANKWVTSRSMNAAAGCCCWLLHGLEQEMVECAMMIGQWKIVKVVLLLLNWLEQPDD